MRRILSLAALAWCHSIGFGQPMPHYPSGEPAGQPYRWGVEEHDNYLTWNQDFEPAKALRLRADEALAMGLQHNLNLWVAQVDPEIAQTQVTLAAGLFDPLFRSVVTRSGLSQLFATDLDQVLGYRQQLSTRVGLQQTTPLGVRYSLEYRTGQDSYSQSALGLGGLSSNTTNTFFSLVVPFLNGAGRDVNEGPMRAAEFRTERARQMLAEKTLETAAEVQRNYWDLVSKRKQLAIQLRAQAHAQRLRSYLEVEISEGRAAAYEAYEAEQNLGLIQVDLEERRRLLILQEQFLLRSLGFDPNLGRVVPLDEPAQPGEESATLESWLEKAMADRPELKSAQLEIQALEAERITLNNQLLPQLDLVGDYRTTTGSAFIGTEGWQVGLQFSFPVGNHQALARAERNTLLLEQARRIADRSWQDVVNDTSLAYKSLGFHRQRWRRASQTRSYALLRTQAESERFRAGFTPAHRVVFAQQYEVISLQKEAEAQLDYTMARINLERSVGFALPQLLQQSRQMTPAL